MSDLQQGFAYFTAWNNIKGGNLEQDNVKADLNLPQEIVPGIAITWTVNPKGYINTSTGQVTRPKSDVPVTLAAKAILASGEVLTSEALSLTVTTTHTVTFRGNGAEINTIIQKGIEAGEQVSPPIFTRPYHNFIKWNASPDGTGTDYTGETFTMPRNDLVLYAQWEADTSAPAWVGDGTANNPYRVAFPAHLDGIRYKITEHGGDVHFIQTEDIDLRGYSNWVPIGDQNNRFKGTFNGNGKTISNLKIRTYSEDTYYIGLFGYLDGGRLENIVLEDIDIDVTGGSYVGGLVGGANSGTVTGCSIGGSVKNSVDELLIFTGGLVGGKRDAGELTISECSNKAYVSGKDSGGLVGHIGGGTVTITDCENSGTISGIRNTGGLVGLMEYGMVTLKDGRNTGKVTSTDPNSYVGSGGIIGQNNEGGLTIDGGYNSGEIKGGIAGGLSGLNSGNQDVIIKQGYNVGQITGGGGYYGKAGGLVASMPKGQVIDSCNTGQISGSKNVGGLVGEMNWGGIENSHNTGQVSGGVSVGGLVGQMYNCNISKSYNTAQVSSGGDTGGLVGYMDYSNIDRSYSTGSVTSSGSNSRTGGLIRYMGDSGIGKSYSTGSVRGSGQTGRTGGLVGQMYKSNIGESYSAGSVEGGWNPGGLVGYKMGDGTITDSCYDSVVSGKNDTDKGTPKTTAEMMQQTTYEGWDFDNTWFMENNSYPVLKWRAAEESDEDITVDTDAITWDTIKLHNPSQDNITGNLHLPVAGERGTTIAWSSNTEGWIDLATGAVTRPADTGQEVTLNATVSKVPGGKQDKDL